MASVIVIQRHAHLAGAVRLDVVDGREGKLARAQFIAISNTRRTTRRDTRHDIRRDARGISDPPRAEEHTAIRWTLWGRAAEHAAQHLGKGSHVNVVGRLHAHTYAKDGEAVHAFVFVADEVDYLDTRTEADSRRARQQFVAELDAHESAASASPPASGRA